MKIGEVEVHVEGDGPDTIVMLHGWPDTYRLWDAQVAALKGQYRCVRFSWPGFEHGDARRVRTLDELAETVKRVVEQVSPGKPVILLLHDWGCPFGYTFQQRHPALVSKIIATDVGDAISLRREATIGILLGVLAYQLPLAFAWMIGGRIGDAITRFIAKGIRCPTDPAMIHSGMCYPYWLVWFAGRATSLRAQFREFRPTVPMLYMYAKRKPFQFHARSWIEYLKSRPGNEVIGFDTGHWVMQADPQGFNAAVSGWLAQSAQVFDR